MRLPLPIVKNRYIYFRGMGIDRRAKNNTVCIYAEGLADNKDFLKTNGVEVDEKVLKKMQPLDVKRVIIEAEYLTENTTRYSGFIMCDHHMKLLPEMAVRFVVKQMAKYIMNDVIKKLVNFQNTPWMKEYNENYKDNQDFYDWINGCQEKWKSQQK